MAIAEVARQQAVEYDTCPSGVRRRQETDEDKLWQTLSAAAEHGQLIAVVLPTVNVGDWTFAGMLFPWMPTEFATRKSPRIYQVTCELSLAKFDVRDAWRERALWFAASGEPVQQVVAAMQLAARSQITPADRPREEWMFCTGDPDRVEDLLTNASSEYVSPLFERVPTFYFPSDDSWTVIQSPLPPKDLRQ